MMTKLNLDDFTFYLPSELIAQQPVYPRDHAKLLIYNRQNKQIMDDYFYNLDKYLPKNSMLVLNNSKVEKCRMMFGKTEVFVLDTIGPATVKALVRPGKKFKQDTEIILSGIKIKTLDVEQTGIRVLEFDRELSDKSLNKYRQTPFPPYIKPNEELANEYQTVYAKPLGSKAAPTAGLHFTKQQITQLKKSHKFAEVTLHVGLGTFMPISELDVKAGRLHFESINIDQQNADILNTAQHITAVGTTSTRVLESVGKPFVPYHSLTDIFIKPGYQFKAVDSLITNFHLPKTSLLMLVSAFIGSAGEMQRAYAHAIKNNYRFYSFGDAMLIL